jgi:dihydroxyacetone kinase-like protein
MLIISFTKVFQVLLKAHKDIVHVSLDPFYVTRKNINPNKVLLVSGGGSGHEPLHTGYIGQGMLDIALSWTYFYLPNT